MTHAKALEAGQYTSCQGTSEPITPGTKVHVFVPTIRMHISKVIGIKYIVFTDISRGCITKYHAVQFWKH